MMSSSPKCNEKLPSGSVRPMYQDMILENCTEISQNITNKELPPTLPETIPDDNEVTPPPVPEQKSDDIIVNPPVVEIIVINIEEKSPPPPEIHETIPDIIEVELPPVIKKQTYPIKTEDICLPKEFENDVSCCDKDTCDGMILVEPSVIRRNCLWITPIPASIFKDNLESIPKSISM